MAAIVRGGEVIASVGYPAGAAPIGDFQAIAGGVSSDLILPGAGTCPAIAVPLDHPPGAVLILARSGSEGLSREEISLLHGMARVHSQVSHLEEGLASLLDELREISRGLHPPLLSAAGLGPALRSLVRRAALPVDLDVRVAERLPESTEVAAYYVVSEALANAAKHAHASGAEVHVDVHDDLLRVHIRDDGAGGADPGRGSGIVGLRDRVEALGGTMALRSPPGEGTSMLVELPLDPEGPPPVASGTSLRDPFAGSGRRSPEMGDDHDGPGAVVEEVDGGPPEAQPV